MLALLHKQRISEWISEENVTENAKLLMTQ